MDRPIVPVQGNRTAPTTPRRNTYKDLINAFGVQRSPTSVTRARRSNNSAANPAANPAANSAQTMSTADPDRMLPDELSLPQRPATPQMIKLGSPLPDSPSDDPPVASEEFSPRRSLRPHGNPDYTILPRTKRSPKKEKEKKKLLSSNMEDLLAASLRSKVSTARRQIRAEIEQNTKVKQDAFLYHHSSYFLPLLPATNYVAKLKDKKHRAFASYRELDEQPEGVTATLKPYQLSGLSFLVHMYNNGMPCMLGDEMGLGKTLQTLSLFQLLEEQHPNRYGENRPYLVVCPLSVVNSWVNEAQRWTPGLKVLRFHGPKAERDALKKVATGHVDKYGNETNRSKRRTGDRRRAANNTINLDDDDDEDLYKIIITTYETFVAEQSWLKTAFVWRYVVLDEGHRIKNSSSNLAQALQGFSAEYRLILTGTPLQNDLHEMWSLLHWMLPEVFTVNTASLFKKSFDLANGQVNISVMDNARQLLELLMLRRMKNSPGVDLNLPPKEEVLLYTPLTPLQRFWYLRLLTRSDGAVLNDLFAGIKGKEKKALKKEFEEDKKLKVLEEAEAGGASTDVWEEMRESMMKSLANEREEEKTSDWTKLMNLVMQLRLCCTHPYLLPGVQPEPYLLGDHIIRASGKFIILEKLLEDLIIKRGKKVLIFSGFTSTLDLCEDLLNLLSDGEAFRYLRFDGSTERARRNLDLRLFNDKSSDYMVMMVSTRAGGLGINLTAATEAIFLDEDWNPQITLQAEARAHRIGQTQPVTIYKICTQGTVEEQMMGRIRKKLYLSAKITESMKSVYGTPAKRKRTNAAATEEDRPHLDVSQLKTLIRRGAQTLSHPEIDVTEMLSWDVDTILEMCRDKPSDPQVSDDTIDEQQWLSSMEKVETAVFDGRRIQRNKDPDLFRVNMDLVRNDRRKGKNTTVMVDGFAVSKQSMMCDDWEAIPTLAGKDPRLADRVRKKKAAIVNQDHCQECWDGGDILLCSLCPRSYHEDCLTDEQAAGVGVSKQFICPQHICAECTKRTSEAGGMLYRCRWCQLAFCEDCLNFDRAELIGDTLPELKLLGFAEVRQAYYVKCYVCTDIHDANPETKEFCEEQEFQFERQWEEVKEEQEAKRVKMEMEMEADIKDEVKEEIKTEDGWASDYI
ncbi:Lymphoid-specific helicase [Lasiodiplodia hormozganensis]|uniref:Lymphoid-specific helicase n=1 Tax=Lasiodiplodia hormozganensis TaxID=869390 RepID=A0AA39XUG3_9PEZI|nr:Lymphoid-specific helicase [Lasiodiplodia hormozganensis]